MVKRLKSIYPDTEENKKDILERIDLLFKKRNLFVHEAIDKITEHDRNFIKGIVEDLIMFFINFGAEFDDIDQLIFLYQNLRKPLRTLQKESQVLELLEKIKSESTENDNN